MIKGVISGSQSIDVTGGYLNYPSFSMNSNNPVIGMMRFNTYGQNVEVFDGASWHSMNGAVPVVKLTMSAETAIAWATKKMDEEEQYMKLAKEYPAVQDLLNQQAELKHKLDMVAALVKSEVTV
jgi:hypothetical protein